MGCARDIHIEMYADNTVLYMADACPVKAMNKNNYRIYIKTPGMMFT